MEIGGWRLKPYAAEPIGRPSWEGTVAALQFADAMAEHAPYWHGDVLKHCATRTEWRAKLDALLHGTGLKQKTLQNREHVASRVEAPERAIAPSHSHADAVSNLDRPEQQYYLERASTEGWTVRELRQHIRADKRRKVLDGRAVLEGQYRVIVMDWPWQYRDSGPTDDGSLGKVARHYPTMSIDQMLALCPKVLAHMERQCIVFFWVPAPLLWERPGPMDVFGALDLTYKANRVWDKVLGNPGHYAMQVNHEHLIIGVRGSCLPDVPTPHAGSVYTERRRDEHSAKPNDGICGWIEKHWTVGPYLYLFASEPRPGWTCWGNDYRLWVQETNEQPAVSA
jgi:N6-adenosine-specific RNA methylase IME4